MTCIDGHNGSWGGYSLISASLAGIAAALKLHHDWGHLLLISGNHVALRGQREIAAGLQSGKSYLRAERISPIERPTDAAFLACAGIHRRLWGYFEEIRACDP